MFSFKVIMNPDPALVFLTYCCLTILLLMLKLLHIERRLFYLLFLVIYKNNYFIYFITISSFSLF